MKGLCNLLQKDVQLQTHNLLTNSLSDKDTVFNNALAMTSVSLSQSHLNNDVGLRNNLQTEIGPMSTYIGNMHKQNQETEER